MASELADNYAANAAVDRQLAEDWFVMEQEAFPSCSKIAVKQSSARAKRSGVAGTSMRDIDAEIRLHRREKEKKRRASSDLYRRVQSLGNDAGIILKARPYSSS